MRRISGSLEKPQKCRSPGRKTGNCSRGKEAPGTCQRMGNVCVRGKVRNRWSKQARSSSKQEKYKGITRAWAGGAKQV